MGYLAAGDLNRRIRIERAGRVDDGYQTRDGVWAALRTVWAQFIPSRGREAREAAGREALQSASFRIRWSSGVADVGAGDRVRFPANDDGQVWDIQSVTEIGRREGLELVCVAGSNG